MKGDGQNRGRERPNGGGPNRQTDGIDSSEKMRSRLLGMNISVGLVAPEPFR